MRKDKVSIIIPVFNHKQYLEACIESAIKQTYNNIEIVIIDDCSSQPEVTTILDEFKKYDFVKIFRNDKNMGISRTQNRCIQESTGELIAFLDCDDLLLPDAIEKSLEYWTEETRYSFSNRIHIDESNKEFERFSSDEEAQIDIFGEHLNVYMYASHLKIIRRDVFLLVGLFNPDHDGAQDYDMLLRIAFHFPRIIFAHVPEFVYKHRIHRRQMSKITQEVAMERAIKISNESKLRKAIRSGIYDRYVIIMLLVEAGKEHLAAKCMELIQHTVAIPHKVCIFQRDDERKAWMRYIGTNTYFILLDVDIEVMPGWIEELLVRAAEGVDIASVSCRVVARDGRVRSVGGVAEVTEGRTRFAPMHYGDSLANMETLERQDTDWNPSWAVLYKGWFSELDGDAYTYDGGLASIRLRLNNKRLVNAPNTLLLQDSLVARTQHQNPLEVMAAFARLYLETGIIVDDPDAYARAGYDTAQMANDEIGWMLRNLP
ncbi:glycosyltransferase [Paenibacillus sp. N1-5-1-14]|uniref:glycosyltransferase n=1 Tax=Paenibacillus radicibacter TaxID=2972488 RepID=UPI0021592551|nr:glycosyltransferase [Paenibacillus radicibacter]MCR8642777.1 glycosyltransferase [Paenibacillus radicibacter]